MLQKSCNLHRQLLASQGFQWNIDIAVSSNQSDPLSTYVETKFDSTANLEGLSFFNLKQITSPKTNQHSPDIPRLSPESSPKTTKWKKSKILFLSQFVSQLGTSKGKMFRN